MMRGILFIVFLLVAIVSAHQIALLYNKTAYVYTNTTNDEVKYPYFDHYGYFLVEDSYKRLVFLKYDSSSPYISKGLDSYNNTVEEVYIQNGYTEIESFRIGKSDRMLIWLPENIGPANYVKYFDGNDKSFDIVYCGNDNFEHFYNVYSVENVTVYVSPDYPYETFDEYPVNRDNYYCNGIQWDIDGSTITFVGNGNINSSIVEKAWSSSDTTDISIEHVIISNGIWTIEDGAFKNREFKTIQLPETLTSIGPEAFAGNGKLTTIDIPPGVTSIESRTFAGCTSLTYIRLPYLLEYISTDAFYGSTNLTTILFCGERNITTGNFTGLEKNPTVNVMKGRYQSETFGGINVHNSTEIEKCEIVDSINRGEELETYKWLNTIFILIGSFRLFGYIVVFVAFYVLRWKRVGVNKKTKKIYIRISLTLFGIGVVFSVISLLLIIISLTKTEDECFDKTHLDLFSSLKIPIFTVSLAKEFIILLGVYFLIFRVHKKGTIIGFVLLAVSLIMAVAVVALMIFIGESLDPLKCFSEQSPYTTLQVGMGFYLAATIPDLGFILIVGFMMGLFCLPCCGFIWLHINFYRSVNSKDETMKDMDEFKHLMTESHHEMTA